MSIINYLKESLMSESSLSRIVQWVQGDKPFAVVSGFLDTNTRKENMVKHKELKDAVRSMGYGYIEQDSGYSYENSETGETGMAEEMSLFIPNATKNDAIALGKKFNQESILYNDDGGFVLMYTRDGGDHKIGDVGMEFDKYKHGETIVFDKEIDIDGKPTKLVDIAYSALKKGKDTHRGRKFAYQLKDDGDETELTDSIEYKLVSLKEAVIPSRTSAYLALKEKTMAKVEWITIV